MAIISDYYSNINNDLLDICREAEQVVEFGCGSGRFLGAYKKKYPNSYCVGFEKFTDAANLAKAECDLVLTGDAENPADYSSLEKNSFDLIIYGDVLEHFIDPWAALKNHLTLLKSNGTICACIPNVSHWSMILNLINGHFEYKDSGLLDKTHLRFFTRTSIKKMFTDSGLHIEALKYRELQTKNTEIALTKIAKILDKPVENIALERLQDWSTYQYLVKAVKL